MGGELDGVLGQQPNPWGRPGRRRWHRAAGSPEKIKEERKKKCAKGGSSSISCNAIQHPKSFPTQEKDPSSITGCPGGAPSLSKTASPNQLSPSKPTQPLQTKSGSSSPPQKLSSPPIFGHLPGGKRSRGEREGPGIAGSSQGDDRTERGPEDIVL